jgi:predicted acyltransferase
MQLWAAGAILLVYWSVFALYPYPPPGLDPASVGVAPTDEVFTGFFAHWNKNMNAAAAFDVWFLNLLPRAEPFLFDPKGIQTLNFVPTIATMIFGVIAGEAMRATCPKERIRHVLLCGGAILLASGVAASVWLCPPIKSLWTPSWTLLTAGVAALVLGGMYHLCEVRNRRAWAFPFVVLGANSILLFVLASRFRYYFLSNMSKLAPSDWFAGAYGPLLESIAFAGVLFVIAFVLHKRKLFIKL